MKALSAFSIGISLAFGLGGIVYGDFRAIGVSVVFALGAAVFAIQASEVSRG